MLFSIKCWLMTDVGWIASSGAFDGA